MTKQKEIDKAVQNLNKMITFAGVNVCRRKQLLRYFDEDHPGDCSSCDICSGQTELTDVSTDARKLLSAVVRTGERFGCLHVIDVVRGSQNAKIIKFGHDCLKTYGIGKDKSQKYWRALVDELIGQGCVIQDRDKFTLY
ncbi:MAG: RecQ family zinc-binding domain-containing protein [Spirochaetes bacterium]|nr:RecQ family zinc-binding domain-containing protein [Spirochaetota bacterium]